MASGKLHLDTSPGEVATKGDTLGSEFSGRDANGRKVMGMLKSGGLATTLLADVDFLWEVPDKWTLEEAATIPVAYAISYYALFVRGGLKSEESLLIHAGAGGVGQAAIAIALHAGCTVFTTVGTLEKRQYLKNRFPQLTDRHIGNSRDTSFEQLILSETHGNGVDVVLNSLMDEKLRASVRCLATNGRFLEIGKYNLTREDCTGTCTLSKNITFYCISLDALFENCAEKKKVIRHISEGIENGTVRSLYSTVFSEQQIEQAFRFIATGKHIGKVLIKIRDEEPKKCTRSKTINAIPRTYMNPKKSYVLIDGFESYGLELTNWMIARGANIIILVSHTDIRTGYQALCIRRWRESGVEVVISKEDVTTLSGAERLIEESNRLAPVGGIFNLAAVQCNAPLENLAEADFKAVMSPKVDSTRNLDIASRKSCPLLDYFVVFSSASCGRGTSGQSNYGLANSVAERMMELRQANGLPGLAIQWGAIEDVNLSRSKVTSLFLKYLIFFYFSFPLYLFFYLSLFIHFSFFFFSTERIRIRGSVSRQAYFFGNVALEHSSSGHIASGHVANEHEILYTVQLNTVQLDTVAFGYERKCMTFSYTPFSWTQFTWTPFT